MAKYYVGVYEVYCVGLNVEAENEQEAKDKARQMIESGEQEPVPDYSHTLDSNDWYVEKIV